MVVSKGLQKIAAAHFPLKYKSIRMTLSSHPQLVGQHVRYPPVGAAVQRPGPSKPFTLLTGLLQLFLTAGDGGSCPLPHQQLHGTMDGW